jgi:hypothetical protein
LDENAVFVSMALLFWQVVELFERIRDPESSAGAQAPIMTGSF